MRVARFLHWVADRLDGLSGKSTKSGWPFNPKTYDYTMRMLGHDYTIREIERGGYVLKVQGWGPLGGARIQRGDYLVFARDGGDVVPGLPPTTRYRVATIEHYRDPDDMWKAELWWHGLPEVQTDWAPEERWARKD